MPQRKQLCIGLSLAPTWLSGQAWRRGDSQVEQIYSLDFYRQLARRAEQVHLDFLFRPDSLFLDPRVLDRSPGFSSLDPSLLLASLAAQTTHIGLVSTASTTFNPPYVVARQIQSLHWLSNGRAGWNIVTSMEGQRNFGAGSLLPVAERYARAREFTEVVKGLWRSFPHEALTFARNRGDYIDLDRLQPLQHQGEFFDLEALANLPACPLAPVPLFQAGASEIGRGFAAEVADAVFAATPDLQAAQALRHDLRARARAAGRQADDVRVLPGLSLFLGRSREQARELYQATRVQQSAERQYALIEELLGVDVRAWPLERSLTVEQLPVLQREVRSQTHADLLRDFIQREAPSVAQVLARPEVCGSAHWNLVGTVEDARQAIHQWWQAGAMDGFIALPGGAWESLDLCLDELVPALAADGLFRQAYQGTTLADHLGLRRA